MTGGQLKEVPYNWNSSKTSQQGLETRLRPAERRRRAGTSPNTSDTSCSTPGLNKNGREPPNLGTNGTGIEK
eukprot:4150147-Pleurochrysis_carterae.AAC.1